jgi:hypothetical protein
MGAVNDQFWPIPAVRQSDRLRSGLGHFARLSFAGYSKRPSKCVGISRGLTKDRAQCGLVTMAVVVGAPET